MEILKTPIERFVELEGYPFEANYIGLHDGLQMHYIDEGDSTDDIILMLHGEPSWSYLYRKMIPVCVNAGFRVLAPDLIGFGKSDKPGAMSDYSYQNHLNWLQQFIEQVVDGPMNVFMQDWGGLLGLRLLPVFEEKINRLILANTFLPNGKVPANAAFIKWKNFAKSTAELQVGKILDMATTTVLSDEVKKAYDAPFPDESYKAGARIFPELVPLEFDDEECVANREIWNYLANFSKPCLTLFSDGDPIMKGAELVFQSVVPGCQNMPHEIIKDAGHFLQEDKGEEIAEKMISFIKNH
jgi:haloalkane dehalogenase